MSEDWLTKRKTMKQNVVLWLLNSKPAAAISWFAVVDLISDWFINSNPAIN